MDHREQPLLYHPRKAIEHVIKQVEYIPIRLFALLFPLWLVETVASQERKRPYALIEQYLVRGIGEGELHTTNELVRFFGLSTPLVEKALSFLQAIRHVACQDRRWILTERGIQSLRAGEKHVPYTKTQNLYFDGFRLHPLPDKHYHKLPLVTDADSDEETGQSRGGYQFQRLHTTQQWLMAALSDLERRTDRASYNVPDESRNIQCLGTALVYLPMYVIEAKKRHDRDLSPYYLVYTHIPERRDEFFEQIMNTTPEILRALQAVRSEEHVEDLWDNWLRSKGLAYLQPERDERGLWKIILPRSAFSSPHIDLTIAEIGKYRIEQGYFLQIWCQEDAMRRQAVLESVLKILQAGQRTISRERVQDILHWRSEQLQVPLPVLTPENVYRYALNKRADESILRITKSWLEPDS